VMRNNLTKSTNQRIIMGGIVLMTQNG